MPLSTSNSEPAVAMLEAPAIAPPRRPKRPMRTETRCVIVFFATLAVLFGAGRALLWRKSLPRNIVASAKAPKTGDWYVSYSHGGVDASVIYHDIAGAAEAAKKADVLFLGNSRVMFALKQEALRAGLEETGLSYYVLGFPYAEQSGFFEKLIQKHDLRPKWVVINADPFFSGKISGPGKLAVEQPSWDAWKLWFETTASFGVRRVMHKWVPYIEPFAREREWVLMRRPEDGTTHVASMRGKAKSADTVYLKGFVEIDKKQLAIARRFVKEMNARGAQVVLTCIPPRPWYQAWDFAHALQVPLILPELHGLKTCDRSHLDERSARLWTRALTAELSKIIAGESWPVPKSPCSKPSEPKKKAAKPPPVDEDDEE